MKEFNERLKNIRARGLLRKPLCIESSRGSRVIIEGKEYCNFSSNDYLGLSGHPGIVKAAADALGRYGFGSGASRLMSGTCTPHKKLEEKIAAFKGTGSALAFSSGYAANTGIIPAIAGTDTVVFSDALNHASLIDGIRLSRAEARVYQHRDLDHLESLMKRYSYGKRVRLRRKLIITDTIFSMDGDIAPLGDILSLCRKYGARLMIDEAHASGVLGATGRGGLEHFRLNGQGVIQMGTLSKAFGCIGGFVAGSPGLISFIGNTARSFLYSTSLPPANAAACSTAVDIVSSRSTMLRKRLWNNRELLWKGLRNLGYNTLESASPIVPVLVGSVKNTMALGGYLFRNGIFAPAIRPPTVPQGTCRIRFSVTAAQSREDIDCVLRTMEQWKRRERP